MFRLFFKLNTYRRYLPIVSFALVSFGILALVRHVPWHAIHDAFASAERQWIVIAIALTFLNVVARAVVLLFLVRPSSRLTLLRSVRYTVASITGNIIAPLRAGIALRAWLLVRYEKVTVPACVGIYVCEKIADVASLLVFSVPLPWLVMRLPPWAVWSICVLAAILATSVITFIVMRGASWGTQLIRRVSPLANGGALVPAALATLCAWFLDMLAVMSVLRAVGAPYTFAAAAFILLAINLVISVPAPANGGTLELGALVALHALGVGSGKAIAFAVLYHAAQVLPILAIGVWDGPMLWQTGLFSKGGRAGDRKDPKSASDSVPATLVGK